MSRDLAFFPNDNIGDFLWEMQINGSELDMPKEVEFSVLFQSQALALQFGQLLLENNQKISFTPFEGNEEYPWEITAYPEMPLNHQHISAYQELLETSCEPLKGTFDGFYCL